MCIEERVCPRCGRKFLVSEDTACFQTCPKCRRPDKRPRHVPRFGEDDDFDDAAVWQEGDNEWDDAVRLLEGA
jgi:hypothetical protein